MPYDARRSHDGLHYKLIVLSLEGDLKQQGFRIAAEFGLDGARPTWEHRGQLPPAPELLALLNQWRHDYNRLGDASRLFMRLTPQEIDYSGSIHDPFANCQQSAQLLAQRLRQWLAQAVSFQDINLRLREFCNLDDRIRVIIRSNDPSIYRLPWHQWDFIDRYQGAEVAFSGLTTEGVALPSRQSRSRKVRILAILGDPLDIDIDSDRALLQALPDAEVTFLVQPDRSIITDQLWDRPWDILFFAGHSKTETYSSETSNLAPSSHIPYASAAHTTESSSSSTHTLNGRIYLNRTDSLSLDELTFGLRQAIRQGLRLAIFNSCDGLGLASALEKLHLPQFIVMREPIPDKIAQTFLNRFLQRFSSGNSFYHSVRQAREQLQGLEQNYPCASWLPVIYQDVSARSLHWDDFLEPLSPVPSKSIVDPHSIDQSFNSQALDPSSVAVHGLETKLPSIPREGFPPPTHPQTGQTRNRDRSSVALPLPLQCVIYGSLGLIIAGIVIGLRSIGWMQPLELKAYDHLMAIRPNQSLADNRLLVISIDEEDIQYQRQQQMDLDGSLSDTALLNVLRKIERHRPAAIGIDILHDFDFEATLADHVKQHPHIFAICRDKTPEQPGVPPPANISRQQLGFTNTPLDPDGIVRRQFLGEPKANTLCQTQESLAFQLARQYLETVEEKNMRWITEPTETPDLLLQSLGYPQLILGSTPIPKITRRAGGYHLPDGEVGGYQMLINYRATPPKHVTLRELLSETSDSQLPDLITNRIILIGVVDNKTDLHMTPYNQGTPRDATAGVMVQAQTASHIISAVVDNRPLIQWWSEQKEAVWILAWGLIGGFSIVVCPASVPRWLILCSGGVVLYVGSLALLLQGLWVPFIPASLTFLVMILIPMNTFKRHNQRLDQ